MTKGTTEKRENTLMERYGCKNSYNTLKSMENSRKWRQSPEYQKTFRKIWDNKTPEEMRNIAKKRAAGRPERI
jgi:hypothetical protein